MLVGTVEARAIRIPASRRKIRAQGTRNETPIRGQGADVTSHVRACSKPMSVLTVLECRRSAVAPDCGHVFRVTVLAQRNVASPLKVLPSDSQGQIRLHKQTILTERANYNRHAQRGRNPRSQCTTFSGGAAVSYPMFSSLVTFVSVILYTSHRLPPPLMRT